MGGVYGCMTLVSAAYECGPCYLKLISAETVLSSLKLKSPNCVENSRDDFTPKQVYVFQVLRRNFRGFPKLRSTRGVHCHYSSQFVGIKMTSEGVMGGFLPKNVQSYSQFDE